MSQRKDIIAMDYPNMPLIRSLKRVDWQFRAVIDSYQI